MTKILIIPFEQDGKYYVDYGVDVDTLKPIVLPQVPMAEFVRRHCVIDKNIPGWILRSAKDT